MNNIKSQIHSWVEQGYITQLKANELYQQETILPDASSWRSLIANQLLWFGALSLACGIIFFFAYNWQALGRFAKFSLIEVSIVLAIAAFTWCYYRDVSRRPHDQAGIFGATTANGVLMAASLLVGGLLALVGQTYQTGADPWQLFVLWALIILPFAWVAGFDALWLLIVVLINLGLILFFDVFYYGWDIFESNQSLVFILLNLFIYYVFVFMNHKVVGRWRAPILEYFSSILAMGCFTCLSIWSIFDGFTEYGHFGSLSLVVCGYFGHLIFGFFLFRYLLPRVYPLALGGFSLIAVVGAFLIKLMFEGNDFIGSILFIGLYIILASTGLSIWLRTLSREFNTQSMTLALNQGTVGEDHGRK